MASYQITQLVEELARPLFQDHAFRGEIFNDHERRHSNKLIMFDNQEFTNLPDKLKVTFTLFVLLQQKQYQYLYRKTYKLIEAIERPFSTRTYKVKKGELAVFFMTDEKNGRQLHYLKNN